MRTILLRLLTLTLFISASITQGNSQLVILSGIKGGSYEQLAQEIQAITSDSLVVIPSYGSVDNFKQLISNKKVDLTFIQEDVLVNQQLKDLEAGTNYIAGVRILLPFGTEEIHVVARNDNQINTLNDLANKRVAIGAPDQGTNITAKLVKEITGIKWIDVTTTLAFDSVFADLLNKRIDAFFFVGAAPVAKLAKLPPQANIKLIPINDKRLNEIYHKTTIPAGTYRTIPTEIETYSVKFVMATNVDNETKEKRKQMEKMLFEVKENFEKLLTTGHPKWKEVDLNFSNLDWEIYSGVEDIFNPKSEVNHPILLSGVKGGSYHQFANDIQKISKTLEVRTSSGSADNLRQLVVRDDVYMTFLQYDVLINQQFEDLRDGTNYTDGIRILLPMGIEEIHLVTKKESKINSMRDLKNKKVAIGNIDQGTYVTASLIKQLVNGKWNDIDLPFDSVFIGLLNNEIDAFFFVGSAPVSRLLKLPEQINIKLIPITSRKLEKAYVPTVIKAGTYLWQTTDIKTYAVNSVLATNIKGETPTQARNLQRILIDIRDNMDMLRSQGHPKWKEVNFDYTNIHWEIYEGAKEVFSKQSTNK